MGGEEVKTIVVPESVLKKQKRENEWALTKKQEFEAAKKKRAENRKLIYSRAKQYSQEYEQQVIVMSLHYCDCVRVNH
jgi:large subunit ribosomal protein L7e